MRLPARRLAPLLPLLPALLAARVHAEPAREARAGEFVESLLARMTLEEKVGQLTQWGAQRSPTGPKVQGGGGEDGIRAGRVGSFLGVWGAEETRELQRIAVEESRLHIPLLFAYDVIHGFRTTFPVPLAEAASFDPGLARRTARAAAVEATANGLHWTYAPMVDIARDARWGRVVEGAGEDPYLGSALAVARVRGFRGSRRDATSMLATAKHFVAYGAAEGGRDYNTVDVSERSLREIFLPPFRAAIEAGADAIMPAFNEIAGVPMTANRALLRDLLREEWSYRGIVVSDYTAIKELMQHGVAATPAEAGALALRATVDIDMLSDIYLADVPRLVAEGRIDARLVDEAVRRVLLAKYRLGLFEDPYRYSDPGRAASRTLTPETRALAREAATRSIVLLKNDGALLPLRKDLKSLAVIGALAEDARSALGSWPGEGRAEEAVSVLAGIRKAVSAQTRVVYARGASPASDDRGGFAEAERAAREADAVVLVAGESEAMSGEARSRTSLDLPGAQQALLDVLLATGKPVALLLMNGRPLAIPEAAAKVPAILETWYLGSEMGNAVADVLFGDENPSGKLPITFPRTVGQVPIYYNHKITGRPPQESEVYSSKYLDVPTTPLFPFGHGLSYTRFAYDRPRLSAERIVPGVPLTVRVRVRNVGPRDGDEVVQLYLRDDVASVTRPVRTLRRFARVSLPKGASRELTFTLEDDDLALLDERFERVIEPGTFTVFVGGSSAETKEAQFEVTKGARLAGAGRAIPRALRTPPGTRPVKTARHGAPALRRP